MKKVSGCLTLQAFPAPNEPLIPVNPILLIYYHPASFANELANANAEGKRPDLE